MPSAWPILRPACHLWRPWRLGRRQLHGARPTSLKHWSFSLFAAGGLSWYASCASCAGNVGNVGVAPATPRPRIQDIGYITDIEGDLDTFNRYVDSDASVLRREDGVLKLKDPASAFVFGGDLFDRGAGDLRLAEELIQLKRTYPMRVFLIMGNRDINKMRLAAELSDSAMRHSAEEAFQAWWDPKAPSLSKYLSSKGLSDSKVNRLKWILRHTMGAPAAFEHRRHELAAISEKGSAEVNDNEVLQSFLESVKCGGTVARYLQHAQIGLILEDTLFVHGAVEESALGFVPSPLTRYTNNTPEGLRALPGAQSYEDLHGWIAALNQFAKDEVEAWLQCPDWSGQGERSRGGEALMAYQSRAASCLLTVVVSCYVDGKNMPTRQAIDQDKMEGFSKCSDPLSQKVVEYLHRGNVRRVVVGHKPSGEAPAILRTSGVDGKGYEVISADTNYASSKDEQMRGKSWCEVRISQDLEHSQTRLRGQRPDGLGDYDFKLQVLGNPTGDDGDPLVGHQARYGKQWVWVRLKLKTGDYLLSRGYGRTAEYWAKRASDFQVVDFPPVLQKA